MKLTMHSSINFIYCYKKYSTIYKKKNRFDEAVLYIFRYNPIAFPKTNTLSKMIGSIVSFSGCKRK